MIVSVKYNVKKMTEYPMRDDSGQISSNTRSVPGFYVE